MGAHFTFGEFPVASGSAVPLDENQELAIVSAISAKPLDLGDSWSNPPVSGPELSGSKLTDYLSRTAAPKVVSGYRKYEP